MERVQSCLDPSVDAIAEVATATGRISALIRACDLATPTVGLGRWKVRDVVAHLGGVHRWATRIVTTRSMDGPGFTKSKLDANELREWFDTGADALAEALRTNPAEDACPNFNPGSSPTVEWWIRRQLHETTVHRWDIERALHEVTTINARVAADGVDEFLDVFVRTRGKQTLDSTLALATTRPKRNWALTPASKAGRIDVALGSPESAEAKVAGRPEDLLLALWGRLSVPDTTLTLSGDPTVAASLFRID